MSSKMLVVIPAYNEENTLAEVVRDVKEHLREAYSHYPHLPGVRKQSPTPFIQYMEAKSRTRAKRFSIGRKLPESM